MAALKEFEKKKQLQLELINELVAANEPADLQRVLEVLDTNALLNLKAVSEAKNHANSAIKEANYYRFNLKWSGLTLFVFGGVGYFIGFLKAGWFTSLTPIWMGSLVASAAMGLVNIYDSLSFLVRTNDDQKTEDDAQLS